MNADIKSKWIAALSQYRQTHHKLSSARGKKYCCLGVLCLVVGADRETWEHRGFPPRRILDAVKLTEDEAWVLVELNDGDIDGNVRRHTFAEIADYIKEHL